MKALVRHIPLSVQLGVLIALVMVMTAGLGYGTKQASAADDTKIIFSLSNTQPNPATVVVIPPGTTKVLYVWAANVKDPTGVSGVQVDIHYSDPSFNIFAFEMHSTWLASTGRSVSCSPPPVVESDRAYGSCNSIGQASPPGPTGSGIIAEIGLFAAPTLQTPSVLNLKAVPPHNGSFLLSTPPDLEVKVMEDVEIVNAVAYHKCGDVNQSGGPIDLLNDILGVINRFQWTTSHPEWDWAYDMDENGQIDLLVDILGVISQFQVTCYFPE